MNLSVRLPWINRRRPFIVFHVAPFPSYRIRKGSTYKTYHCGLIWGRQFMQTSGSWVSSWWFDIELPSWWE